ncbi:MAG: ATP-dependent zinc metalloprotease FtsH [Salinivirgaceae bacterium]|nr:ATP-dependent zinc metalloprotease FtsH [Salinivirgaceae bacterium]
MNEEKNKNINDPENKNKPKFNIYWIYGVIALTFLALQFFSFEKNAEEINYADFKNNMLLNNHVEKVIVVNKDMVEVYIKANEIGRGRYVDNSSSGWGQQAKPNFYFRIGSMEHFETQLQEAQKTLDENDRVSLFYETRENYLGNIISYILPIVIIVGIWIFIMKRMSGPNSAGGQIFNIGKSKAKLFDKGGTVKIDFSNVAGLDEAKVEIKEIVDFLKSPEKYTDLGGKIPKGALLVGPPGTGKTLLAKAVAGEAHVPFFSMSGSDFVEMFVGVGASRVRDLFKTAKEKSPCIIFIDEIDAIGRARGKNPNMGSNDERENTLNQLLTEMDGFETNSGVIILAATNRADILDKALLRAGRFDRQIHVELPDLNGRKAIFKVHMEPLKKLDTDIDVDFIAKQTPGFSGADIANVCNEAALIAARKSKEIVSKQDFLDAIDRIVGGLEKRSKVISPAERKTIAYHEAGHATVSWMLEHANPLVKVTIIPRGQALGAAWYLPEERQLSTQEQIFHEMCAIMGGRASEKLIFGKVSTGALNDLERVTKQAYALVSYYGMSEEIGNMSFYDSTGQSEYSFTKPYSEKTAEKLDKAAKDIIEKAYETAYQVLKENKSGLDKLAQKLLEKEVIFSDDLQEIYGDRPKTVEKIDVDIDIEQTELLT